MKHEITFARQQQMLSTAFGSVIMGLLQEADVIEIMLNPDGCLWVERFASGKTKDPQGFSAAQAENMVKLVAAAHDIVVNHKHPELACELSYTGARFQAWLPPVTASACFTIRKPAVRVFTLDDYIQTGGITEQQVAQLKEAVQARKNILIAGGTGSGKTTFSNALLHELAGNNERIIILEDLPELQLHAPDVVKMRTSDEKSMRDLVKGVLRMRPDRIIIGEVRDGAALELLKAWNTGHPGGLCTIHANSATSALTRLEDLVREVVATVPTHLIDEAIDLVVYIERDQQQYRIAELLTL